MMYLGDFADKFGSYLDKKDLIFRFFLSRAHEHEKKQPSSFVAPLLAR